MTKELAGNKPLEVENAVLKDHIRSLEEELIALKKLKGAGETAEDKAPEKMMLQDSETLFRILVENVNDVIYCVDTQGNFTYVSPSLDKFYKYNASELLGKHFEKFIHPDDLPGFKASFERTLSGQLEPYEFRGIDKDGTICHVRTSSKLIKQNGQVIGLSGVMVDLTEQKKLDREMARLERLHLIGEMAASIGHEVRNPMTSVRGFLQMMMENFDFNEYQEYFQLMIDEIDRANNIIISFLSMANNKLVDLHPQNINQTIRSIFPLINADAIRAEKAVTLNLNTLPLLQLDIQEIRQLILNLTRNGLEAMDAGGLLTIGTYCENNKAILYVKDQGPGLDPSIRDTLGTPFMTTKENGTGLGLAVCYSIVSRHHASIDVDSGPKGTTFYIRFDIPTAE